MSKFIISKRVSWTEKFLWDLYKIYEKFGDFLNWPPRSWQDVLYPEYKRLRQIYQKKTGRRAFRNLIYYLKKKGLIKSFQKDKTRGWLLSEEGKRKILEVKENLKEVKKRKDGKWLMIIFDIPEKIRIKRNFLRAGLQGLGFQMLQKSIWVSPYDVLAKTENLIKKYFLKPYTRLLLIEEVQINNKK
ncbi:MAG: hypothetical protein N2259_02990 [Patescibacteria group bacterium]|nr:hypothetical protein [Patescibacteria group bacterium]